MNIDDIRKQYPGMGLAVYAMEPEGPVTLEFYEGDQVYTFTGPTFAAALESAFPPKTEPPPEPINVLD